MKFRHVAMTVLAFAVLAGCSKRDEESAPVRDQYLFAPVRTAAACIAVLEKPDAKRVLLLGEDALKACGAFETFGMECFTKPSAKVDIAFVACSGMSEKSREKVFSRISDNGVLAWLMDVRGVKAADFRAMLESFGSPSAHLWMPGENRWLLVGRKVPRRVKLSAVFERFSSEGMLGVMDASRLGGMPELFSGYAGTVSEVMPAFESGDLAAEVKPEFFLTREIPAIDWISAEKIDNDVKEKTFSDIRSMQVVRRLAVEGGMQALGGEEEKALSGWNRALMRNPYELFVRERIDRLERNAKGFLEVKKVLQAMKCYETIIKIDPGDLGALHNFGVCMRKIGREDMAKKILDRVMELQKIDRRSK